MDTDSDFYRLYRGYFRGVLRWHQLDALWESIEKTPHGWYVYFINHPLPEEPLDAENLQQFLREVDSLLRAEHEHDYCGIVYTDSFEQPAMVKIFDPANLGASCGSSGEKIPPRWLLSRIKPLPIHDTAPLPGNRKRWWQRLLGEA